MIGFVCTSINPNSDFTLRNIKKFEDKGFPSFIVLDRKNRNSLESPFINFRDEPQSEYERVCAWDSYARKNIGFIRASRTCDHIFETDDDNLLQADVASLNTEWEEEVTSKSFSDVTNIFSLIYDVGDDLIWARGLPLACRENNDFSSTEALSTVGVRQYLVQGNPDVDAIFRLVKGKNTHYDVKDDLLPLKIYNTYHPFNSQGTLWPKKNLSLAYLPATCEFRMTDIWRGYAAQHIMYAHGECVSFEQSALYQERNEHDIAVDFFGEYEGYKNAPKVLEILSSISKAGKRDMLYNFYDKAGKEGIFDHRREMVMVTEYLNALS